MTQVIEKAMNAIVDAGALGAVLLLVMLYAFWVTRKMFLLMRDYGRDRERQAEVLKDLGSNLKQALGEVVNSLDDLTKASDEQRKTICLLGAVVDSLDRDVDQCLKRLPKPKGEREG